MLDPSVYLYSGVIGVLIVVLLFIFSLFELKGLVKIFFTVVALILITLHYIIIYNVSHYERLTLYPFTILEETDIGGSVSPDIGQVTILALIILWRKELLGLLQGKTTGGENSAPSSNTRPQ